MGYMRNTILVHSKIIFYILQDGSKLKPLYYLAWPLQVRFIHGCKLVRLVKSELFVPRLFKKRDVHGPQRWS